MTVDQVITETIKEARRAKLRDPYADALDGHADLIRLKVAAAVAILAERLHITEDDWRLAAVVLQMSDSTRSMVVQRLKARSTERNRARAVAEGEREAIKADTAEEQHVRRLASALERRIGDVWILRSELRKGCASRDREWFDAALEHLDANGVVEINDNGKCPQVRRR
jgi:hypothetical protein